MTCSKCKREILMWERIEYPKPTNEGPNVCKDCKHDTTPRIPDEVMREIEAEAREYCNHPSERAYKYIYDHGAQAFYLKGREDMAKRIVEWLSTEAVLNKIEMEGPGVISSLIEAKFLSFTSTASKLAVRE